MPLSELTNRDAVLAAINEYDGLGQDAFLKKYGYSPARRYQLVHDGRGTAGVRVRRPWLRRLPEGSAVSTAMVAVQEVGPAGCRRCGRGHPVRSPRPC